MEKKLKVYIYTVGCNRRLLDAQRIKVYCENNGYQITIAPEEADYIVINTCALDNRTEKTSLDIVKKFNTLPGKLIVAGCLPKINKPALNKIYQGPNISPTSLDTIQTYIPQKGMPFKKITDQNEFYLNEYPDYIESKRLIGKKIKKNFYQSKNFIKETFSKLNTLNRNETIHIRISWGCLGNCSYCAIKNAIGKHKSKPLNLCISEFSNALQKKYKYFELLADDIGAYGLDIGLTFPFLLKKILIIPNNFSLYLQDIHPRWLNLYEKELKEILMDKKIIKTGFPIQSGSKKILKLMHRDTNIQKTKKILLFLKKYRPDLKIDTHIIIGFPGETESDFKKTLQFVKNISFSKVWIYKFDKKINTEAYQLSNQVPNKTIIHRIHRAQIFFKKYNIDCKMIWEPIDSDTNQYL